MTLEEFDLGTVTDWAGFMFIRVLSNYADGLTDEQRVEAKLHMPVGYVFVIDPKFGSTAQYKLQNGHKKPGETPFDTAVREAKGETGICIPPERVTYKYKELGRSGDHWRVLFDGYIFEHELKQMDDRDAENEGEQPKYFTVAEFHECVRKGNFMRAHFKMLEEAGLVLPLGRDKVA